jgi:5-methyltetrahydrofolate--homocysteine methyltransferase
VVGEDFEKGNIFLPQLIKSADAAQAGFSVINQSIIESGKKSISKGDVVVATVKGDVHDIGKNISKVILENYGFNVIDLGKDVDISRILEVIEKKDIKLVGLSALMTTTLENMKETIKEIRKLDRDVKIMVGGAVLTSEYSKIIGADYYVKDSKADVEVANKIFGGNDE